MNFNEPKVSVIIPTFKRATNFLLRSIQSIENQTYKNIEIIVVDDNMADSEYRQEVSIFMKQFYNNPNVIYYKNPENVGGSLARNNGINIATGEFITFLDDDDEYLPKKIEKQIKFMLSEGCDMSFTNLKLVNENKIIVDYREYKNLKKFDKESLLKFHIMKHLTGTPTFMYKTKKIVEIGGFEDAIMGQEFYLMLKTIEKGLIISYLDDCDVIAYRDNKESLSQGINKINGENILFEFKKQYFSIFNKREKMFIRFRHFAVLAVTFKRNKNYTRLIYNSLLMFIASPFDFTKESIRYINNVFNRRKIENNI